MSDAKSNGFARECAVDEGACGDERAAEVLRLGMALRELDQRRREVKAAHRRLMARLREERLALERRIIKATEAISLFDSGEEHQPEGVFGGGREAGE